MKKFKILMINTIDFSINGISNVIVYLCKYLLEKHPDIKIDVLGFGNINNLYRNEFSKLNINFIESPRRSEVFKYRSFIKQLIFKNNYDLIHVHGNSSTMIIESTIAHDNHQKIVLHSHNSKCKHKILNILLRPILLRTCDLRLACSDLAGKNVFGKKFHVIYNGIDFDKYKFSYAKREFLRSKFSLHDKVVLLHVGHFNKQKNQKFLIRFFRKLPDNYFLFLIGDGKYKEKIISKLKKLHLNGRVICLGQVENAYEYYNIGDLFVFPSLYEGLPLTCIEAQTNGLKCFFSNRITKMVKITSECEFLKLKANLWAKKLSQHSIDNLHQVNFTNEACFFDNNHIIDDLYHEYQKLFFR